MVATIGIAVHRKAARLAVLERRGRTFALVLERRWDRAAVGTLPELLRAVLSEVPASLKKARVALALSPGDLACADRWIPLEGIQSANLARIGPAMCEARCAGETVETLAVDLVPAGQAVQAVALSRESLEAIVHAASGFPLALVTSIPSVLSSFFPDLSLTCEGEAFEIRSGAWRARPVDSVEETSGNLTVGSLEVPAVLAPAVAVALIDPDEVPNALRATPAGRPTFVRRHRDALLGIAAAAALCLASLGVRFHQELRSERAGIESARRAELELWRRFLPSDEPRPGKLLRIMSDRLRGLGEGSGSDPTPSALGFWSEIAAHFPDPDALGLTLDALDLASDGGRLLARVPAAVEDPLKNASQLEGHLARSRKLRLRGDYEVREGEVQIRLRLDYRP